MVAVVSRGCQQCCYRGRWKESRSAALRPMGAAKGEKGRRLARGLKIRSSVSVRLMNVFFNSQVAVLTMQS